MDGMAVVEKFLIICRAYDMGIRIGMTMDTFFFGYLHSQGNLPEGKRSPGYHLFDCAIENFTAVGANQVHAGKIQS
jgi:hypothetical protein